MKLLFNALGAALIWSVLFPVRIILVIMGLPIVAIALPFATERETDRVASWDQWRLIRLPWWAWLWDNKRDGAMGDVRGTYPDRQAPDWADTEYLLAYNWLALRNPVNNFSRWLPLASVDINGRVSEALSVGDDHLFLRVIGRWGIPYYQFMWQFWDDHWLKLGHKIDLKYNTKDWTEDPISARKGFTFRIEGPD